ncbi:hypothetical protein VTO42DRAFT_7953 [Malbranchea cinnamomea]
MPGRGRQLGLGLAGHHVTETAQTKPPANDPPSPRPVSPWRLVCPFLALFGCMLGVFRRGSKELLFFFPRTNSTASLCDSANSLRPVGGVEPAARSLWFGGPFV